MILLGEGVKATMSAEGHRDHTAMEDRLLEHQIQKLA